MKGNEAIKLLEQLSEHKEEGKPVFDVNIMMTVLSHLTELLAQETAYLKKRQISKLKPLQEEKDRLIKILEILKAALAKSPQLLEGLDSTKKTMLRELIVMFETVMQENHLELIKTNTVNQKVIEAVTGAIQKKLKEKLSYSDSATTGNNSSMPPIAFSEEI